MSRIGTETAFEAAARARALEATGRSVIHLEIGEPDFDTPRHIKDAAARGLLDEGMTHYTAAEGIAPLREAIAADVRRWKGIEATPDQVIVTPGAKPIMFYAMLALVDEGDEVIYPNPGFPIYESMTEYAGGVAVAAPLREEREFRMDVEEVASLVTPRTRMIVINSPHNPTGSVMTPDDVRAVAEIANRHDLVVLADEIYGRLQYEGEPLSIATLPGMAERTITLDGFSKTFAMTGWRLGYGIVPAWLGPTFSRLVINSVSCTNAFAQAGAIAALTGPQDAADAMREEFGDLLLQIVLHAQIALEYGEFSMADVIAGIQAKIIRRHPHVFGDVIVKGVGEVLENWEKLKAAERGESKKDNGVLGSVPPGLPALLQADTYQRRAARVGFDWPDVSGVIAKVREEMAEIEAASAETVEDEVGDLLFAVVNWARWLEVEPESALRRANVKFAGRFAKVESAARVLGQELRAMSPEELDQLWEAAKKG